jgi:hypothetical protein
MPIWLRRFTFTQIQNYYKEEKEAIEKKPNSGGKQTVINTDGTINKNNTLTFKLTGLVVQALYV